MPRTGPQPMGFDVVVVGLGPTGATLAALLGGLGVRTAVLDRTAEVFAQPRAVGFDHDAMRIFQHVGIAEHLGAHVERFRDAEYVGCDGRVIQRSRAVAPPFPFTWAPNYTCDQPGLETVLRAHLRTLPTVHVALGHELHTFEPDEAGVVACVADPQGRSLRWAARVLVGCDGASSRVRRHAGIELQDLDYDEPWIVVDLAVGPEALRRLPQTNVQYCDPRRPCTYVVCPGNHRRWEFMRLDGEPTDGAIDDTRLWSLLAPWLAPHEATIRRAAAYRFHALVAQRWRAGPVFLAGDAAHQTPPFLGQGMCQGLRDAGNLAWKLALALRGQAAPGLLDTYERERRPHVMETTRIAKTLGQLISERDPRRARARDAALLERGGGSPPTLVRQAMIPGLVDGLVARGTPLAGRAFVQPRVTLADGAPALLDDATPPGFRVVVDADGDGESLRAAARAAGIPVLRVGAGGDAVEHDDLLSCTFADAGIHGAVIRPDHYVYGGFADAADGARLLRTLARLAFAAGTPHPAGERRPTVQETLR